jgi:LPS export ABC transporter protein LptC
VLATLALVALGAAACRPTGDGFAPGGAPPPAEGMRGIQLQNFQEGDTRWVLRADTASVFRDRKRVEMLAFTVDFFDGDRHVSTLTADRGVLMQATDDLEARGDVRVVSDDGAMLRTELLYWDHARALIHTADPVEITRGEDVLTGVGLEADPGLDRVDLKRAVRGTVRSDPERLEAGGKESRP